MGLLSGVIGVCGLWEHTGNDAPLRRRGVFGSAGNYGESADSGRETTSKHKSPHASRQVIYEHQDKRLIVRQDYLKSPNNVDGVGASLDSSKK